MIYITHEKSIGRSGHQLKDAITPLIIAEIFGFTFVPAEYSSIEIYNLGEGRLRRSELPPNISIHTIEGPHWRGVPYEKLNADFSNLQTQYQHQDCLILLKNSYRVQLFQTYSWHKNGQLTRNIYDPVVKMLRKNFTLRNPNPYVPDDAVKVAVHVRRGDVANPGGRTPSSQHYAHAMEYYDSILKSLKECLAERKFHIDVFTELSFAEDVVDYCAGTPDVTLHQGGKAEFADHICRMVYSDILVVSNSSMSQMAGYLSEGLKIYHPNDQYHSLPEDEFLSFDRIEKHLVNKFLIRNDGQ